MKYIILIALVLVAGVHCQFLQGTNGRPLFVYEKNGVHYALVEANPKSLPDGEPQENLQHQAERRAGSIKNAHYVTDDNSYRFALQPQRPKSPNSDENPSNLRSQSDYDQYIKSVQKSSRLSENKYPVEQYLKEVTPTTKTAFAPVKEPNFFKFSLEDAKVDSEGSQEYSKAPKQSLVKYVPHQQHTHAPSPRTQQKPSRPLYGLDQINALAQKAAQVLRPVPTHLSPYYQNGLLAQKSAPKEAANTLSNIEQQIDEGFIASSGEKSKAQEQATNSDSYAQLQDNANYYRFLQQIQQQQKRFDVQPSTKQVAASSDVQQDEYPFHTVGASYKISSENSRSENTRPLTYDKEISIRKQGQNIPKTIRHNIRDKPNYQRDDSLRTDYYNTNEDQKKYDNDVVIQQATVRKLSPQETKIVRYQPSELPLSSDQYTLNKKSLPRYQSRNHPHSQQNVQESQAQEQQEDTDPQQLDYSKLYQIISAQQQADESSYRPANYREEQESQPQYQQYQAQNLPQNRVLLKQVLVKPNVNQRYEIKKPGYVAYDE